MNDVVQNILALTLQLQDEWFDEHTTARWPSRAGEPVLVSGGDGSDPTMNTAVKPDPVNAGRAKRIATTLRVVERTLRDEVDRPRRQRAAKIKDCTRAGCPDRATVDLADEPRCRKHYQQDWREEQRKRPA